MRRGGGEGESTVKILHIVKLKLYFMEVEMEILKLKYGMTKRLFKKDNMGEGSASYQLIRGCSKEDTKVEKKKKGTQLHCT